MRKVALALIALLLAAPAFAQDVINPQTNASALTTGTVAAARGGAGTITGALKGNGSGTVSQAACADLSNFGPYCLALQGQLPGITTNAAASAGNIGEIIETTTGTASVSLTTTVAANLAAGTSLTAGDWEVVCSANFLLGATTTVNGILVGLSATSATVPTAFGTFSSVSYPGTVLGAQEYVVLVAPPTTVRLSSPTNYFCVVKATFGTSTAAAGGQLHARRIH